MTKKIHIVIIIHILKSMIIDIMFHMLINHQGINLISLDFKILHSRRNLNPISIPILIISILNPNLITLLLPP